MGSTSLKEKEINTSATTMSSQSKANNSSAVGTSIGSNAPVNQAGSAAFCDSSRESHDRTPEMELFSHGRKPRSNFRRPSSLGLAATPVASKTESKSNYQAKPATRTHIVAPLKDHLRPEGAFEKTSEAKQNYRDHSPGRPVIHKLKDHLKEAGSIDDMSELKTSYINHNSTRPVIARIPDNDHLMKTKFAQYGDRLHRATSLEDISEFKENFINPNSTRPVIYKIPDHDTLIKNYNTPLDDITEFRGNYMNPNSTRSVIHRLHDHNE